MPWIFKNQNFFIIRLIFGCESMFGQINAMSISCETTVDFCKLCLMWTKGWLSLQKCQVIWITCLKDEVAYLFWCKLSDVIQCCKLSREAHVMRMKCRLWRTGATVCGRRVGSFWSVKYTQQSGCFRPIRVAELFNCRVVKSRVCRTKLYNLTSLMLLKYIYNMTNEIMFWYQCFLLSNLNFILSITLLFCLQPYLYKLYLYLFYTSFCYIVIIDYFTCN